MIKRTVYVKVEMLHKYWRRGFDTAAIAKFCHMEEWKVYNMLSAYKETLKEAK